MTKSMLSRFEQGPLIELFGDKLENMKADVGLISVSNNDSAELYYSYMYGAEREDPKYFMATDKGILAVFGATGLVREVYKKQDKKIVPVLERSPQNKYIPVRENLPINGITNDVNLTSNQLTVQILDYIYNKTRQIPDNQNNELSSIFHGFSGNQVLARFRDFGKFISDQAIIPDTDSDHALPPLTTAEGCGDNCLFCCEGGGIKFATLDGINGMIQWTKEFRNKYHKAIKEDLHELMINNSDLLWHDLHKNSPIGSIDLIALIKENLPEVYKLRAFVGIRNTLKIVEKYGLEHLKALRDNLGSKQESQRGEGFGLNGVYIGIETGHSGLSKLLGKPENYDDKKKVIEIYKSLGIPVKAIVQYGFGKEYVIDGKRVSWKQAMNQTIKLLEETGPYRILISEYQNLKNTPIKKLYETGVIIPHDSPEGIEKERAYLVNRLNNAYQNGKITFQGDPKRKRWTPPIEEYGGYVKDKKRIAA